MIIYRLAQEQFAHTLKASGVPNRWNKSQQFVLYASGSVSLCALELLAHTCGVRPTGTFKIMHIRVKEPVSIHEIRSEDLPDNWHLLSSYPFTQKVGSDWYEAEEQFLMKIPSAIVPTEFNFAINCRHPDFEKKVSLAETRDFFWDHRFPED